MDRFKAKDLILYDCEHRLKGEPMHKRLAVLRYMKRVIDNLGDYQLERVIELNIKNKALSEELQYKLDLASERYDRGMAKHNSGVGKRTCQAILNKL